MQAPWRRRLKWIAALTALGVVLILVTGWLMFQHIPDWYQPVAIAPADVQQVRDHALWSYNRFGQLLATSTAPFEYRVTQDQINAWFAVREDIWPLSREWLPPGLSDPLVVIEPDAIRVAATYQGSGVQAVVSARLEVSGNASGIRVRLVSISGGSLPVPASWLAGELARLDGKVWPAGRSLRAQALPEPLPAVRNLPDGVLLPNAWIWNMGAKLPFWIRELRLEQGEAVLQVERLPNQPARRKNHSLGSAPTLSR